MIREKIDRTIIDKRLGEIRMLCLSASTEGSKGRKTEGTVNKKTVADFSEPTESNWRSKCVEIIQKTARKNRVFYYD